MPTRRSQISRTPFDDYRAVQLLCGPDEWLLAAVGYLTAAGWEDMSEADQADALEAMRGDWQRHGATLTAWWNGDDSALRIRMPDFVKQQPGTPPWAAQQFGEAYAD
jgi:hypothetical protein